MLSKKDKKYRVIFLPIGMALGLGWGLLYGGMVFWMIWGMLFGQIIDLMVYANKKKNKDQ